MAILRHQGRTSVTVAVRYFAGAQAAAGIAEESVTLSGPATLAGLREALVQRHGDALARVLTASSFIVDEIATGPDRDADLVDGARVDVLPPFAGG